MSGNAGVDGPGDAAARAPLAYETPADAAAGRGLPHDVDWLRRVAWGWGFLATALAGSVAWTIVRHFHVDYDPRPIPRARFEAAVEWLLAGTEFVGIWWATAAEGEGKRRWRVAAALRACAVVVAGAVVTTFLWGEERRSASYAAFALGRSGVDLLEAVLLFTYVVALARAAGDRRLAVAGKVMRVLWPAATAWAMTMPWVIALFWRLGWSGVVAAIYRFQLGGNAMVAVYALLQSATAVLSILVAMRIRAAIPPVVRVGT